MQGKISGSITDLVLRIFRIVTAEEGPGALATITVNVLYPGRTRLFRQNRHARLQCLTAEGGRQTIEVRDHLPVILHQHRCDWVNLRAEVEESIGAEWLTPLRGVHLVPVYVGIDRRR